MTAEARNIRWFARLRLGDVLLVGGKNASPGEMYAALGEAGVQVPNGFALTLEQRLRPFKVALSVGVMKMARSDMASSGVIFTLDTKSGFRDAVFVGAHSVRSS